MPQIQGTYAREILDSRGVPTVECTIWLDNGLQATSSAPSGTSKGKYEALELRDSNQPRMMGKGVLQAVANINQLVAPAIIGRDPSNQVELDQLLVNLDPSENKAKIGVNSILPVSQAICKLGAMVQGIPLYQHIHQVFGLTNDIVVPTNYFTLINGGQHGATNLDFQEFHIIPASHLTYQQGLEMAAVIFQELEHTLVAKGAIYSTGLGGGFAPNLYNNTDAFEILLEALSHTSYRLVQDVFFGVDIAAAGFFNNHKYNLKDKPQPYSSQELLEYYKNMRKIYQVLSIEDPFQEDDWESWTNITRDLGPTTTILADDLVVTNRNRTLKAIEQKACNAILVKPNQAGTITETVEVINAARGGQLQVVVSHRNGETNDDFVADFAVAVGAEAVKFGPTNRGERLAKLNRLWQIEVELAAAAQAPVAAPAGEAVAEGAPA